MSCCFPFKGFKTGYLTDKGKDEYMMFSYGQSDSLDLRRCSKPINLANVSYHFINGVPFLDDPVDIPCGKCVGCRMDNALQWKIRCCLELQYHKYAYFITLTYDDDHLPFNDDGEPILSKYDLQCFWKRFRKAGYLLSYFACGEYGDKTKRPHYHALVYLDKDLQGFSIISPNKFTCKTIQELWPYGHVMVEEVTPGNVSYVCGYVEKKQLKELNDVYPVNPFRLMSRRPAIGYSYLKDHLASIESTCRVYGIFSDDGRNSSARLPRSMLRKFEETEWYKGIKEAAKAAGESMSKVLETVYKTTNKEEIGSIREVRLYKSLDRKRSKTL